MDLTQLLTPIKLTSSFLMQLLTWLPDWTVLLPHSHQGLLVPSQLPHWLPGYLYNYQQLYLSTASLGISQRAIVSAVGGARAIHLSSAASPPTELDNLNSSYLDLLDCCTNIGINVVHHLFTLAELFTLAGFNLTHTAVSTSFYMVGIQIFYSGQIAQQLVETINGDGGDVSIKDFSEYWPIVKSNVFLKTNWSHLQDQKFIGTVHRVVLSNETVYLDGFSHSKPGSGKYLGASLGLSARAVVGKTQHLQSVTDARKALSSFGSLGLPQLSTFQMQKSRSSSPSLNPGRLASFEAAMNRLRGRVVSVLANKSSATKGGNQISFFSQFLISNHNIPYITVLI
ncbi:hypothetical protein BY996DRAFT_8688241 [Phakopsora pachyrhizi]|nr:hypothetical protein BY996DRAFT_8688241 [Phakopsora pachyrhizi]